MITPIIIREVQQNEEDFAATVQFGSGAPYPITVSDPFSEEEEARLEWYFEKWLKFPFTKKVLAKETAASIRVYGEDLFEQVFRRNPDVYLEYQRLRQADFLLEIVGSPEFHALHWEALHDPNQARPLAVDKPMVRKNSQPVTYRAELKPAPQLRVLLVTARPAGARDVSYRTISRPLVDALETGKVAAQIDMVRPGTFAALVNQLEDVRDEHGDGYYHIIHLDMHGALLTHAQYQRFAGVDRPDRYTFRSGDYAQTVIEEYPGLQAFLFFDNAGGKAQGGDPVSAADLARLLNARQIPIVILNACQSGKQVGAVETSLGSRLLDAGVQLVVAMGYSITVSAARLLMTTLYRQLLAGREPAVAIRRARLELYNDKRRQAAFGQEIQLEDWLLPVIYQNRAPGFDQSTFRGQMATVATVYAPPRTTYRFVGRDIDILQVERRLLYRRNLLLVRGMGGVGKTTLLHHLGWWWQKTNFVEEIFYFGYDIKAYYLPEIVSAIGQQLGLRLSGLAAVDRATVLRALKCTRHLLILDNLESITGERLAVQNTLPSTAQAELRGFLQELVATQTLVLLGSRGGESWLRPDPLRDGDVYDLPGLDPEAQTELAETILRATGAPHYPELAEHQNDFRHLLKLLGGYPLAMEVVLGNLAQAAPAQIIARLQAADVNLDNRQETAQKTESILKCIDYSHSNLSAEAQALLLCLAPFTGVFNITWLEQYTAQLKAQPALADLPYEQWPEVLQEALNGGLLKPHEQLGGGGYLRLQPIFPYFLKTRLNDAAQAARKQALENAFREHYNGIGGALAQLLRSKEAQERQLGQLLMGVEEENLLGAVQIALRQKEDFWGAYDALEEYLDQTQMPQKRLLLSNSVVDSQPDFEDASDDLSGDFLLALDRLGLVQLQTQQYEDAGQTYRQAFEQIENVTGWGHEQKQRLKASTLHQLGIVAQEQRQWGAAEGYYQEALQIYVEFNERYEQAGTLHQLGIVAQKQRQWGAAEGYYQEALQIKVEFNERYAQASTLHQLGRVAEEQRQWQQAEEYYQEALKITIEYNTRYDQGRIYHHLGMVAEEQRQWGAAEGYYQEALQIFIEFQDRHTQAKVLHQLGIVAQKQRQWGAAEGYYQEALQIYVEFNARYAQASTLHQLGMVAQEQRQWGAAEGYYQEALQIKVEFNERYEQAGTLHQLGIVAQEQRQWGAAEGYYQEALQIKVEFHDRYAQASTLGQLGLLAEDREDWARAADYTVQTAAIFAAYEDPQLEIALRILVRLCRAGDNLRIVRQLAEKLDIPVAEAAALLGQFGDTASE